MSITQIKRCLDILLEYPAIKDYIINFDGKNGFIYTIEEDPIKKQIQQQMNELLDDGSHSGASWGFMLRKIQAILNGTISYEDVIINKINYEHNCKINNNVENFDINFNILN